MVGQSGVRGIEAGSLEAAEKILTRTVRKGGLSGTSPDILRRYLRSRFAPYEREVFMDSQHRMIEDEELCFGTIDGTSVHPQEVMKAALKHNASAVCFAHNHPSGVAEPSQADIRITERLRSALALVDVEVHRQRGVFGQMRGDCGSRPRYTRPTTS